MPWSEDAFPAAMRHLDPRTRSKAVEIANALLREGCEEGFAIRVAISRAHKWVQRHPQPEADLDAR
jgi:uncharacterized protein YdaT